MSDDSFSYKVTNKEGKTFTRTITKKRNKSKRGGRTTTSTVSGGSSGDITIRERDGRVQITNKPVTQEAALKVETALPPRNTEVPISVPIKTLATEENIRRVTIDPEGFNRTVIATRNIDNKNLELEKKDLPSSTRTDLEKPVNTDDIFPKTFQKFTPTTNTAESLGTDTENTNQKVFEALSINSPNPNFTRREAFIAPLVLAKEFGRGFVNAGVNLVKGATVDIDKTLIGATNIITGETTIQDISDGQARSFRNSPAAFAGELSFDITGFSILNKPLRKVKDIYISAGTKKLDAKVVVSEEVAMMGGDSHFPETSSSRETIARFETTRNNEGYIKAITASPDTIKGGVSGAGRKGAAGLEDPGIYVTPYGDASPAFLRLEPSPLNDVYSFNPLQSLKASTSTPTFTTFQAKTISRLPENVSSKPGFTPVENFFDTRTPDSTIFVTKRSQLGRGEIPRQEFFAPKDFVSDNLKVKVGDRRLEAGTGELEAVVPKNQPFVPVSKTFLGKLKGFESYVRLEGRNIPIRDTRLVSPNGEVKLLVNDPKLLTGDILSGEKVFSDSSKPLATSSSISGFPLGVVSSSVSSNNLNLPSGISSGVFSSRITSPSILKSTATNSSVSFGKSSSGSSSFKGSSKGSFGNVYKDSSVVTGSRSGRSSSSPSGASISSAASTPSYGFSSVSFSPSSSKVASSVSPGSSRRGSSYRAGGFFSTSIIRTPSPKFNSKRSGSLFSIEILKKGKFKRVGRSKDLLSAVRIGKLSVGSTANRTFRVLKNGKALKLNVGGNYRRSKSKTFGVVEKSKIAINTPGEIKEITGAKRKRGGLL